VRVVEGTESGCGSSSGGWLWLRSEEGGERRGDGSWVGGGWRRRRRRGTEQGERAREMTQPNQIRSLHFPSLFLHPDRQTDKPTFKTQM
jgi:hypothetical protein